MGVSSATNNFIVYCHHDMYLPEGWDRIYCAKVLEARQLNPRIGLFGVYGAVIEDNEKTLHGHIIDRHFRRMDGNNFPRIVDTVDECLFGFYKDEFPGCDEELGWHLYASDLAFRFRDLGRSTAVLDALCFHNSSLGIKLPQPLLDLAPKFGAKWSKYLPIGTPCVNIHPDYKMPAD
jgi:hypothetical protein